MGNRIVEKIFVQIGGIKQGMFLKSVSDDNPVLLFLHGGPGSPEIAFEQVSPSGLDEIFTVCWWEQRGCGITYKSETPRDSMTLKRMITDAMEVS